MHTLPVRPVRPCLRCKARLPLPRNVTANALARVKRAEQERTEGDALGQRVVAEWQAAQEEESRTETALREAVEALQQQVGSEEEARGAVAVAREALERTDKPTRELRDRLRRLELAREGAERELADVAQRTASLAAEHEQLAAHQRLAARDLASSDEALAIAQLLPLRPTKRLAVARESAREWREKDG